MSDARRGDQRGRVAMRSRAPSTRCAVGAARSSRVAHADLPRREIRPARGRRGSGRLLHGGAPAVATPLRHRGDRRRDSLTASRRARCPRAAGVRPASVAQDIARTAPIRANPRGASWIYFARRLKRAPNANWVPSTSRPRRVPSPRQGRLASRWRIDALSHRFRRPGDRHLLLERHLTRPPAAPVV